MSAPPEPTDRTAELAQTLHDAACNCGDTAAGQNTYWLRIAAAAIADTMLHLTQRIVAGELAELSSDARRRVLTWLESGK